MAPVARACRQGGPEAPPQHRYAVQTGGSRSGPRRGQGADTHNERLRWARWLTRVPLALLARDRLQLSPWSASLPFIMAWHLKHTDCETAAACDSQLPGSIHAR